MSKSLMKLLSVSILAILLAACGGAGDQLKITTGNGKIIEPPPPPDPVNETLIDLSVTEGFAGGSVFMAFDVAEDGSITNVNLSQRFKNNQVFHYQDEPEGTGLLISVHDDPQEFNVVGSVHPNTPPPPSPTDLNYEQLFTAADIDQEASTESFRVYKITTDAGEVRNLTLLIPGDPIYDFQYTTLGLWDAENLADRDVVYGAIAFGIKTKEEDMPTTGTATFDGITMGNLTTGDGFFTLFGDVQVDVDFSTGQVDGVFSNMMKTSTSTGIESVWKNFTSTASMMGNFERSFEGTTKTNDGSLVGTISGGFYGYDSFLYKGPVEIGGSWLLGTGTGETAIGAFVAKRPFYVW